MRSEFEKHFLSLKFATEGSAQRCLDSCTFDSEQDAYLPNVNWISDNDEDECVIYCCMLNTSYISFKDQQTKVDELQAKLEQACEDIETFATAHQRECEFKAQFAKEKNELKKRVDAAIRLLVEAELYQLEPNIDLAVQALKGEQFEEHHEKAELQKRVDAALKLISSLKAENDLWGCDQVERQIELLEQALKWGWNE